MKGKANKAAIGAFVLGAIALLVAGVLSFGSGKLFVGTREFVVYFEGSVKGLTVGSPVIFRGVKVGSVTDIRIAFDPREIAAAIPVVFEIERDKFRGGETDREYIGELIDKGLRAQLQMQSFVTGQFAIYLDFYPDTPVVLRARDSEYPEIPSILSTTDELQKTFAELPLEELVVKMQSAMDGIDRLVNSPDLHQAVASLGTTAEEMQKMVRTVDREIRSMGEETRRTTRAATKAFNQAEDTLEALRRTAADERTYHQLQTTLREMATAARSIRALADYLERHPEALLRGKAP